MKKLKVDLPYAPAIPLLSIYQEFAAIYKRYLHTHIYSSTIHNSQPVELAEVPKN
jgi:hypothetical protein